MKFVKNAEWTVQCGFPDRVAEKEREREREKVKLAAGNCARPLRAATGRQLAKILQKFSQRYNLYLCLTFVLFLERAQIRITRIRIENTSRARAVVIARRDRPTAA